MKATEFRIVKHYREGCEINDSNRCYIPMFRYKNGHWCFSLPVQSMYLMTIKEAKQKIFDQIESDYGRGWECEYMVAEIVSNPEQHEFPVEVDKSTTIQNKIIQPYNCHYKALIQYNYGHDLEARKRAWVTYISNHWDAVFPYAHIMEDLRVEVKEFCEKNGLNIILEQSTDIRFTDVNTNTGNNLAIYELNENNQIVHRKTGVFISPNYKYRNFAPYNLEGGK